MTVYLSTAVLALLLTIVASSASLECNDNNCTEPEPVPILQLAISSFIPINSAFDDAIDPLEPVSNTSQSDLPAPESFISINFAQIVSLTDEDKENPADTFPAFLQFFLKDRVFADFGILDLSSKNITGDQLAYILLSRQMHGQPVSTLLLSNSRIHGLTTDSFRPAETTLQVLHMDNCSVSLGAFYRLSNLKLLNLSNTGLSTFEWYPQLRDSLEVLDLSHNQLEEIRPELSVLTSLRRLYLSHNRIKSVKEYPLAMLPNLEVLSLTMNSLSEATFTSLKNLQLLELDWNYLWRLGYEVSLPSHRLAIRLASNPWRCDCGVLDARDNYDVLDLDQFQCANSGSYDLCDVCQRDFLPTEDGRPVYNLTKDSIEHLGCTGLTDQFYLLRNGLVQLRDREPEKLMKLGVLVVACVFLLIAAVMMCRQSCSKKKFDRQSWIKVQQIPYLTIKKLDKPQEVPYIKIGTPDVKA